MAIGTGTAIAIGAGAGLLGAKMTADAAKSAAQTQASAADRAAANERAMYEQGREDLAPYRETGYTALREAAFGNSGNRAFSQCWRRRN